MSKVERLIIVREQIRIWEMRLAAMRNEAHELALELREMEQRESMRVAEYGKNLARHLPKSGG